MEWERTDFSVKFREPPPPPRETDESFKQVVYETRDSEADKVFKGVVRAEK